MRRSQRLLGLLGGRREWRWLRRPDRRGSDAETSGSERGRELCGVRQGELGRDAVARPCDAGRHQRLPPDRRRCRSISSGNSVSSAGDVNGDGFADLIIGAPGAESAGGASGEGESYVVFGGNFTGAVTHLGTTGNDTLTGTAGGGDLRRRHRQRHADRQGRRGCLPGRSGRRHRCASRRSISCSPMAGSGTDTLEARWFGPASRPDGAGRQPDQLDRAHRHHGQRQQHA